MTLKEMINNGYVVILDTNVLLNIYRYSPEFSDFALECLKHVKEYIILPSTVRLEYERHRKECFSNMKKRVEEVGKETGKQIELAKKKIISSCSTFKRLQYEGADELVSVLSSKLDAVDKALIDFFENHASLNLIQQSWGDNDFLFAFIQEIDNGGQVMPAVTQEDIYHWCEEGKNRYKSKTPPGFEDEKNKDGVQKYSDLILWKEVLIYAKKQSKSIIFVTDDVKADWYEEIEGDRTFHSKLLNEFSKTGQKIEPMTSKQFLASVSSAFGINLTDAIEIALRMTDESYYNSVYDSVYLSVENDLMYNATDYIDESTAHIGSEGIDEFEITDYSFDSAERVERNDDKVVYEFKFFVALRGTSYEYWGRDDDTKEVITSYGCDHEFEGYITVRVEREVQVFFDFEYDNSYDSAEIIYGDIKETSYLELAGELGYCPMCGNSLYLDNDGGNGFCRNCTDRYDK